MTENNYLIIILATFIIITCLIKFKIIEQMKNYYYKIEYPIIKIKIISKLDKYYIIRNEIDKYIQNVIKDDKVFQLNEKMKNLILRGLDGGKRVRSVIMISLYQHLTNDYSKPEYLMDMALFIELIHSSSLILDDIMDKDIERRGKKALYIVHGETYAILVSIQMIALALKKMFKSLTYLSQLNYNENANNNVDIPLIIGNYIIEKINSLNLGQFMDQDMITKNIPNNISKIGDNFRYVIKNEEINIDIVEMIHKKTSSLFEISYAISWIIANKNKDKDKVSRTGMRLQPLSPSLLPPVAGKCGNGRVRTTLQAGGCCG